MRRRGSPTCSPVKQASSGPRPAAKAGASRSSSGWCSSRQTTTRSRSENSSMVPVTADPPAVRPTTRGSSWMAAITASAYGRTCCGAQSAMLMTSPLPISAKPHRAVARGQVARQRPADARGMGGHRSPEAGKSAVYVEIADTQALAAFPELKACVNPRPVPGWLNPPARLGYAEERVEPQVFHAADLGSVSEDDQGPCHAMAPCLPLVEVPVRAVYPHFRAACGDIRVTQ